jgi:hypothetical protein
MTDTSAKQYHCVLLILRHLTAKNKDQNETENNVGKDKKFCKIFKIKCIFINLFKCCCLLCEGGRAQYYSAVYFVQEFGGET